MRAGIQGWQWKEEGTDGRAWGWLDVVLRGREKTRGCEGSDGASRLIPSVSGPRNVRVKLSGEER